jgi:hypothetical protein
MVDMKDIEEVKGIKSNMHAVFDTPQGLEVMAFLEQTCGWYQSCVVPGDPQMSLVNDGRRQVLATIKTFLKCTPEQISLLAQEQEQHYG